LSLDLADLRICSLSLTQFDSTFLFNTIINERNKAVSIFTILTKVNILHDFIPPNYCLKKKKGYGKLTYIYWYYSPLKVPTVASFNSGPNVLPLSLLTLITGVSSV